VVRFVCEELGVPVPDEFSVDGEKGPDMVLNLATPPE
jgi:aarF domain-containing kinase